MQDTFISRPNEHLPMDLLLPTPPTCVAVVTPPELLPQESRHLLLPRKGNEIPCGLNYFRLCRCHDVMATCACGQDKTFGQLLESYSDSLTGEPLPAAFSMQLFDDLKNTSFCSLYSSSSEPGFNGACQVRHPLSSLTTKTCRPACPLREIHDRTFKPPPRCS